MKKLLTVSLLAIMSVSAANAKIASTEYMAKVAGATLADDGAISELGTTAKKLVPAINEVKGTADSALSKANANAQTLQSMATSETVSGIDTRLSTAEGEIDTLQAAIAEGGSVTTAIAAAKKAGDDAAAAVETLKTGQVATNTASINTLTNTKLDASEVSQEGSVGQLVNTLVGTKANELLEGINGVKEELKGANEAIAELEDNKVDQTTYDAALGTNGTVTTQIANLEANKATTAALNQAKQDLQTAIDTAVSGTDGNGGLTADIAAAQKAADDAAAAVTTLENGQVKTNKTNIENLTNTVNDATNGLATKATKAELGINGTLTVPTECQGAGKECALVIINGVAEWQVVQK